MMECGHMTTDERDQPSAIMHERALRKRPAETTVY